MLYLYLGEWNPRVWDMSEELLFWGVECVLAVVGIGGPVKRSDTILKGDLIIIFVAPAGVLRTMKASYTTDDGNLRVIRPLVSTREVLTRDFSYAASLPVINENCPACFEAPKERQHVKKLLSKEESLSPVLYASLRSAMAPLMDETLSR
eukprot:1177789-Prorocentrum_minimum.AAC.2